MLVSFVKMHSLGNDFVIINGNDSLIRSFSKDIIARLSCRRTGIGFDQILFFNKSVNDHFNYNIFNADGSSAEQCLNGARCIGRYIRDYLGFKAEIVLYNGLGYFKVKFMEDMVAIALPMPILCRPLVAANLFYKENSITVYYLDIGNPHAVVFIKHKNFKDLYEIKSYIAEQEFFNEGCNFSLCYINDLGNITMRMVERGAGETMSSGSSACAAIVAAVITNKVDHKEDFVITQPGGQQVISWGNRNSDITIRATATLVYKGEITLDC